MANKLKELKKRFPDNFNTDFEHNKKVLQEMGVFQSKSRRNIAAGFLVRLSKEKVL